MFANLPKVSDGAPIFGMNTVDDPKDLKAGECVELVNARPGTPPVPRAGNVSYLLSDTESFELIAPAIAVTDLDDVSYVVLWVYDTDTETHKLIRVNPIERTVEVLGEAEGLESPFFSFEKIHGMLYCFVNQDCDGWNSSTSLIRHKVVEFLSNKQYAVRDMNIRQGVSGVTVSMVEGDTYAPVNLPE